MKVTENVPVTYLLKKSVKVSGGDIATEYFTFNNAEKYKKNGFGSV